MDLLVIMRINSFSLQHISQAEKGYNFLTCEKLVRLHLLKSGLITFQKIQRSARVREIFRIFYEIVKNSMFWLIEILNPFVSCVLHFSTTSLHGLPHN